MKKQILFICLLATCAISCKLVPTEITNELNGCELVSSLLNGLVLCAIQQLYLLFCSKHSFNQNLLWITAISATAIITEYFQGMGILKGTFDILDILVYEIAHALAITTAFNAQIKYLFADC